MQTHHTHHNTHHKGFTLLELLVVISILAVLAAVTVVVLNPAELLRRARDSQRFNDLAAITSAISLYMTDTSSPNLALTGSCSATHIFPSVESGFGTTGLTFTTTTAANAGRTDGTGWIKVNLNSLSTGSPIPAFPVDPTNNAGATPSQFYVYACQSNPPAFQLVANLESTNFNSREDTDGGLSGDFYETGTIVQYITAANLDTIYPTNN